MGCSNGTLKNSSPKGPYPDNRVPFTKEEILDIHSFWDFTKGKFEDTAKENLIRFFHQYPFFQQLFPQLRDLKGAHEMRQSLAFEIQAIAIFGVFDEIISNLEKDVDRIFMKLDDVARIHLKVEGFSGDFFHYMEEPFIESLKDRFNQKFSEKEQVLFTKLFKWISECLQHLYENSIPGD